MRENTIEQKLIRAVENRTGKCLKFTSSSGVPDRIILLPGGKIGFLELKAPGKTPRPLQRKRISQLQRLGFVAGWADSSESVERMILKIEREG